MFFCFKERHGCVLIEEEEADKQEHEGEEDSVETSISPMLDPREHQGTDDAAKGLPADEGPRHLAFPISRDHFVDDGNGIVDQSILTEAHQKQPRIGHRNRPTRDQHGAADDDYSHTHHEDSLGRRPANQAIGGQGANDDAQEYQSLEKVDCIILLAVEWPELGHQGFHLLLRLILSTLSTSEVRTNVVLAL